MTTDEIRKLQKTLTDANTAEAPMAVVASAVFEVAAQLAELNSRLERLIESYPNDKGGLSVITYKGD